MFCCGKMSPDEAIFPKDNQSTMRTLDISFRFRRIPQPFNAESVCFGGANSLLETGPRRILQECQGPRTMK